jgi:hypothetical protein
MGDDVVLTDKTAADVNAEVFRLAADPGVNDNILADKYADAERALDARRPPTQFPSLHPGGCRAERKRMYDPRGGLPWVANQTMARLQPLERFRHRCRIRCDQLR